MFQSTTRIHFAPKHLHESLAETEARVQQRHAAVSVWRVLTLSDCRCGQWDAEAQANITTTKAKQDATRSVLNNAQKAYEKPLGGTLGQGGLVSTNTTPLTWIDLLVTLLPPQYFHNRMCCCVIHIVVLRG